MVHKHREILNNRNAIFSLCEASCEAQFKPDVTSFFVGWCIYENFRSLLPRPWLWIVRDTFIFLYDLFKDYKKRIENQRLSLPFAVCRKRHA